MPYLIAFGAWVLILSSFMGQPYTPNPSPGGGDCRDGSLFRGGKCRLRAQRIYHRCASRLFARFLERRPWLSGIFLGLLSYKPHIGVLFPLALLASRNWRALASATLATVILGIGAAFAFGPEGWASFLLTLLDRQSTLSPDSAVPLALHSVFGLLRWVETGAQVSWSGHLIVAAIGALTVWVVWAKPIPFSLKAAVLCIGSAIVPP